MPVVIIKYDEDEDPRVEEDAIRRNAHLEKILRGKGNLPRLKWFEHYETVIAGAGPTLRLVFEGTELDISVLQWLVAEFEPKSFKVRTRPRNWEAADIIVDLISPKWPWDR